MRLWHKDLISVLPRQQLISQWRECCCIAKNIATKGTPNHLLVNKVMIYPVSHFSRYCSLVFNEMKKRGYKIGNKALNDLNENICIVAERQGTDITQGIFDGWHNERYFWQCYYNLQEKFDCGGITIEEWQKIEEAKNELFFVGRAFLG